MNNINERFKLIRKDYLLTQKEFANRLGITNAHISAIEKCKTTPSNALVKLMCKEFGVSYNWLIKGEEPIYYDAIETKLEQMIQDTTNRFNKILTRDNNFIREKIIPLEKVFIDIIELPNTATEEQKISYYNIIFNLLYHLNNYINFYKEFFNNQKMYSFTFPDNISNTLKQDLEDLKNFFIEN